MNLPLLGLSIILSAIPVFFWTVILWRKHRRSMFFFFMLNFLLSMGFAALFYHQIELRVEGWIQNEGTARIWIFLSYLVAGIIIEYGKNFIVRLTGGHYFHNVDDVMDLSFATALGFTFYLNLFHFYQVFNGVYPNIVGPVKMLKEVIQDIFYILPIHLLCSGFFGYFYGVSLFAHPKLQQEHREKHWRYKLIAFKTMKIMEGTFISVLLYGIFFTLFKFNFYLSDILNLFAWEKLILWEKPFDQELLPVISFIFFNCGTLALFYLIDRKRMFLRQNLLVTKDDIPAPAENSSPVSAVPNT